MSRQRSVAVVGGGIAGLTAARALAGSWDVTVLDSAPEMGGKVRSTTFRGRPLDRGPDAFITRNSSAIELCRALGLGEELIAPAVASAAIWARGRLRPFPKGLAIGIPTDFVALARSGIVSPIGAARAALDALLPGRIPPSLVADARRGSVDPTVGALIGRRLGRAVLRALVDPMIGGINASDIQELSFVAALPQLAPLIAGQRRIAPALRPRRPTPASGSPLPVFYGLSGGLGSLTDALVADITASGVTVRTTSPVATIERTSDGRWQIHGPGDRLAVDAVVVAVPAPAASGLFGALAPRLAEELAAIPYASVATVTLAWESDAVPADTARALAAITRRPGASTAGSAVVLPGSGVLVPRGEEHLITAATFVSSKWPRSSVPGEIVVRASVGRYHDDHTASMDDRALVDAVRRDLAEILGISAPPIDHRIERWPASFPQYVSGHLARVDRIRSAVAGLGQIAVCGAAYDGIGIPACIDSGLAAAAGITAEAGTNGR